MNSRTGVLLLLFAIIVAAAVVGCASSAPATTTTTEPPAGDTGIDYPDFVYSLLKNNGGTCFDLEEWKTTEAAQKMLAMERNGFMFTNEMDPAVLAYWEARSIHKELHDADDETIKWASYTPTSGGDNDIYPVVFCFAGGVGGIFIAEGMGIADYGAQVGYITVCATASGGQDAADQVVRILDVLESEDYPVDRTQVYLTGQSAGGMAAAQAALELPDVVAAIAMHSSGAALSVDASGVEGVGLYIPEADYSKAMDYEIPMFLELGECDFDQLPLRTQPVITGLNLWLQMNGCPAQLTLEDCLETATASADPAVKLIGVSGDRTSTQTIDGAVYHTVDFLGANGVSMVELVGVENLPHWVSAAYPQLAWEFMSRFSKDASGTLIVAD